MTTRHFLFCVSLFACACVTHAADGDEAHFKPKSYAPHKSLSSHTYSAAAYTPSGKMWSGEKRYEAAPASERWRPFKSDKAMTDARQVHDELLKDATAYTQQKQISVPTIKADAKDIPEKKPFEESGKKLTDLSYKPSAASKDKNPLLSPRQSIEAPQ